MGFSLSGGLSAMGGAIAETAGLAALEMRRSELEKEKMTLADMLADRREERSDVRKAAINEKAATREYDFRAGESLLNRGHEIALTDKREAGEDRRLETREKGEDRRSAASNARMAASERAAQERFDAEMKFRTDQAKDLAKDKAEQRLLEAAITAGTVTIEQPYTTADGEAATRPMKAFDGEKAAAALRRAGRSDLASIYAPAPVKSNVTGKPRPPLESFNN